MIERLVCVTIGYLCGLFQTGYIIGKLKGIDIREHGSGNAGTTNIHRTMGLKYGLLVLFGDIVKCGIAILICKFLYKDSFPVEISLLIIYAAMGAILGHNFPFYMKFKGGKGLAATAGFVIFGLGWQMTLICFCVFALDFMITHYVSLGAFLVYLTILISTIFYWKYDLFGFNAAGVGSDYIEYFVILLFLTVLILVRHKENIKRLLSGTERKTYLKSRPEIDMKNNH